MKIINLRLVAPILIFFGLISCGFEKGKEKQAFDNYSETSKAPNGDSEVYTSAESWESWSPPKELSGYSLVNFVTDPFKMNGLHSASARYEKGDEFITVQIIDGTSDQGKREIRDHLAIAGLQRNHSSEYGYEKTLERNGIKAKEEYLAPPAGQYLIKFMHKEHYGVSIKSNVGTAGEIWSLTDKLGLESLRE